MPLKKKIWRTLKRVIALVVVIALFQESLAPALAQAAEISREPDASAPLSDIAQTPGIPIQGFSTQQPLDLASGDLSAGPLNGINVIPEILLKAQEKKSDFYHRFNALKNQSAPTRPHHSKLSRKRKTRYHFEYGK